MKKAYLDTALGIAIAAAIFVCGMSLGFVINQSSSDPGDAGTWASALLAGLAFGGTIWIATQNSWQRKRAEMIRAQVGAAGLINRIGDLYAAVEVVRTEIRKSLERTTAVDDVHKFYKGITHIQTLYFKADELLPFVLLPNKFTSKLMNFTYRIDVMESVSATIKFDHEEWEDEEYRHIFLERSETILIKLIREIRECDEVAESCREAISNISEENSRDFYRLKF